MARAIAFVSKRHPDFDRTDNWDLYVVDDARRGAPRQLTTFEGPDINPDWGGRPPSWSPDGKSLAYVQGGPLKLLYYAGQKVAIVPAAGGPAQVLTADAGSEPALAAPHGRRRIGALPPGGRSGDPPGPGPALRRTSGATGGGTPGHQ